MAPGAAAVAAWGVGGWSPPAGPQICGSPWSQMCFVLRKPLAGGLPPDPRNDIPRATRSRPTWPVPENPSRAGRRLPSRDHRVPSLRGDVEQPGGQPVGERVTHRLEAALDTLPGGTAGWERTPQRWGGWGCPAPSSPVPDRGMPRWGSLPATSEERESASALHRSWRNCNNTSDLYDRSRVRSHGDFVSGDDQSEPDNAGIAGGTPFWRLLQGLPTA